MRTMYPTRHVIYTYKTRTKRYPNLLMYKAQTWGVGCVCNSGHIFHQKAPLLDPYDVLQIHMRFVLQQKPCDSIETKVSCNHQG